MRPRIILSAAVAAATLMTAACAGTSGTLPSAQSPMSATFAAPDKAATNVIKNGCFDTGTKPWLFVKGLGADTKNKPSGAVKIVTGGYGTCKHAAFAGTTKDPAPNGLWGVAQTVKMTTAGKLTWWYYGDSTESVKYGDQEVDVTVGGKVVDRCYSADTTNAKSAWKLGKCSLSKFKGQTVTLVFGVYDNGYDKTQDDWYVSDISLQ